MTNSNHTFIVGIYDDVAQADRVISHLYTAGFQEQQIAVDSQQKGTQSIEQTLIHIGVSKSEAHIYEEALLEGRLLMVVKADERRDTAVDILRQNGGNHIWYAGVEEPLEQAIPLREERLHTSKQMVVSGEVRIHRRVIIEEKTITVKVAREEVVVEQVSFADGERVADVDENSKIVNLSPGQVLHIPVREEQLFVEKRPIVKEEIIISRHMVEDVKHISETVRKEVPRLERQGNILVNDDELTHMQKQTEQNV